MKIETRRLLREGRRRGRTVVQVTRDKTILAVWRGEWKRRKKSRFSISLVSVFNQSWWRELLTLNTSETSNVIIAWRSDTTLLNNTRGTRLLDKRAVTVVSQTQVIFSVHFKSGKPYHAIMSSVASVMMMTGIFNLVCFEFFWKGWKWY